MRMLATWLIAFASIANAATQPSQPADGPGGAHYTHSSVDAREVKSGAQGWWLFTPNDPLPRSAPVIVFLHGWSAMNPRIYRGWIDHLVRRGNIVVFANYQDSLMTRPTEFLPNAVAGIRGALDDLAHNASIHADTSHLAIVGHSAGGLLSAEIAAVAASEHLPPFRAVMPVEPGDGSRDGSARATIPSIDVSAIPSDTLLLVVVGADDKLAGEQIGLRFYDQATHVPASNKNVIELESDNHGSPPLLANHAAPAAIAPEFLRERGGGLLAAWLPQRQERNKSSIDALDWFGTWKLLDALCDAAFDGRHRDIALGGTPQQLSMGEWSDGVPVKPMRVLR